MIVPHLDPGIWVGMIDAAPEQKLCAIVTGRRARRGGVDKSEAPALRDPIAAGELIRDMEALRA